MEGHSGQMVVDMNGAYQDVGITAQQQLQQQEHQQVNGNGMPDASMQHATYFAVEELAMVQQQQQLDYAALQQQQQREQYEAVVAHNINMAVNMSMSQQSGEGLAQQSSVQSLTPFNQDGAPNQGFHYMDPQAAAAAHAQMAANGMGGQVRFPASMGGPCGSIEPAQHPGAEWAQQAGHHASVSQQGLAAAHSRISSTGAVQKVPIHREPARRDSRRSSGSPGAQKEKEGAMTVLASGPMSSAVTIQARPKPGRKPIPHEDAQDRRRVQNRVAQRNFRDKRQQKLQDAVDELAARKMEYESKVSEYQRQIDALTQQNNQLQSQLRASLDRAQAETSRANAAEERARALESQVASYQERTRTSIQAGSAAISGPGSIGGFRAISSTQIPKALAETSREADAGPSPPASEEDQPYEIDFTNYGRTTQAPSNYGLRVMTSNDSNEMDFSFDRSDDKCGFCTDDQNCACKQEKVVERVIEAPIVVRSVTLPGSCDMCRADPVRAQACRDMARSTNMSAQTPVTTPTSETPRTTIFDSRTGLTAMMPPPRMSCSSMVDAFNKFGERTSSIASLFGGKALTAYPAATGGYEFEETQAAEVLSTLSRRSTMAESPQPDDSRRPSLVSTKTS